MRLDARCRAQSSTVSPAPTSRAVRASSSPKIRWARGHRGVGHRDRARADFRVGAHALRHRERTLKKLVEHDSERAFAPGQPVCLLELTQNLRFAEHHGIETARDPHHVAHRGVLPVHVDVAVEVAAIDAEKLAEPAGRRILTGSDAAVQISAIAGRENRRFAYPGKARQRPERRGHPGVVDNHPFTELQRSGGVIQSEGDDRHDGSRDASARATSATQPERRRTDCLNLCMKYSDKRIVPTMNDGAHKPYREPPMAIAPLQEGIRSAPGLRTCVGRRLGGFALAALVTAGALTGCGFTDFATSEDSAISSNGASEPARSDRTLNGDVLYKLLVGELASHRGDLLLALKNYLEVAEQTRDAAVAARATKLAVYAHADDSALEAARLWIDADPSSMEGRAGACVPAHSSRRHRRGGRTPRRDRQDRIRTAGCRISPRRRDPRGREGYGSRGRDHEAARARARGRRRSPARACPPSGSHRKRRRGVGGRRSRVRTPSRQCKDRGTAGTHAPARERRRRCVPRA